MTWPCMDELPTSFRRRPHTGESMDRQRRSDTEPMHASHGSIYVAHQHKGKFSMRMKLPPGRLFG
jgi:hypothetical protein